MFRFIFYRLKVSLESYCYILDKTQIEFKKTWIVMMFGFGLCGIAY